MTSLMNDPINFILVSKSITFVHSLVENDETSKEEEEKSLNPSSPFESNSSDGQRSPPPSMVYGQGTPLMSPTMMYMSQYMNPYLQVGCEAKKKSKSSKVISFIFSYISYLQ